MVAVTAWQTAEGQAADGHGAEWDEADRLAPVHVRVSGAPGRRVVGSPSARQECPSAATYRRRRAVAAGLAALVVGMVVWAVAVQPGGGPLPASGPSRPRVASPAVAGPIGANGTYVVQPGDTFWSLARRLHPKGDVRPLVDRLVAAHGGSALYVGERIALPPS